MSLDSAGRRAVAWVAALVALASSAPAWAQPSPKLRPDPGVTAYEYTMIESLQGQPERGFRVDFDLISGADQSLVAAIKAVWTDQAGAWTPTAFDPACVTALHGQTGELARVTLNPLPADAADMGASFMATCAPDPLFLSMTDILNVALVQVSPKFGADKLRAVGDSAPSDAFQSSIDRPSVSVKAASPGGRTELTALAADTATVDWVPDLMQLTLVERNNPGQGPITLAGTEHFSFRLLIDPRTGVLQSASAPYDDLAVVVQMPGLDPKYAPHLAIKRAVTIVRR